MPIYLTGPSVETTDGRHYAAVDRLTGKLVVVQLSNEVVEACSTELIEDAASAKFDAGMIEPNGIVLVTEADLTALLPDNVATNSRSSLRLVQASPLWKSNSPRVSKKARLPEIERQTGKSSGGKQKRLS